MPSKFNSGNFNKQSVPKPAPHTGRPWDPGSHQTPADHVSSVKPLPSEAPKSKTPFDEGSEFTLNIERKLKTYLRKEADLEKMYKEYKIYIDPYNPSHVDDLVKEIMEQFPEKFSSGGISKAEEDLTHKRMRFEAESAKQAGKSKEFKRMKNLEKFMKDVGL